MPTAIHLDLRCCVRSMAAFSMIRDSGRHDEETDPSMQIPGLRGKSPLTIGRRALRDFSADDMTTYAAALAYHGLLALFPFVIFLIALLGILQVPQFFDAVLEQARTVLPQDAYEPLKNVITEIQNQQSGGLLSFGILGAIWAASSGIRALMKALNTAYDVEETRPMWKMYLLSVLYTIGLALLLVAAIGLMLLGPQAMEWLAEQIGLGGAFVTIWTWARWPLAVILLTLAAAVIYYVSPNVEQPFALITPGSLIAVVVWILATIGFSIYVSNFGNYSATYGSLGGVIALLFFFFISAAVLLLGAEINAEIHHVEEGEPTPKDDPSGS